MEQLEDRMMLSITPGVDPVFRVHGQNDVNVASVDEGTPYAVTFTFDDLGIGLADIEKFTIDWKDGTVQEILHPANLSTTHTYTNAYVPDPQNGFTTEHQIDAKVTLTDHSVWNDVGDMSNNKLRVSVNDLAFPSISGAASVNEGSTYTLNLAVTDPGTEPAYAWQVIWNYDEVLADPINAVPQIDTYFGAQSSVTHVYDDGAATHQIVAVYGDATTAFGGQTVSAAGFQAEPVSGLTVTVNNVAPTVNAGGPYSTIDDTAITLTATATDPANPTGGPIADPLSFAWDLNHDGIFETSGPSVNFNPVALGISVAQNWPVAVRVSDGDGGVTTINTSVQILGQGTILSGGVLSVVGSGTGGDIVQVGQSGGQITVSNGATQSFSAAAVSQIQIRTRGGNDIVIVGLNVTTPVVIDGGAGNDLLTAGGGDSVLLGGTGNDVLVGGPGNNVLVGGDGNDIIVGAGGRDVMIGGHGNDALTGGNGEDILIGGYTTYDANVASLDAIMAVWSSSASFSARVVALTGSGGLLQAGVTVLDDDAHDTMNGGAGRDLYFADVDLHDHDVDLISLQQSLDALVAVN
jgi:Ca2+-binding RTX toxin-like protein